MFKSLTGYQIQVNKTKKMKNKSLSKMCIKAGDKIIPLSSISSVDISEIEDLKISILLIDGNTIKSTGIDALENVWLLKPSSLEGKRLRWAKRAWMTHNIIGHPLMQILAFLGFFKKAMWVHDITVPKPLGPR